MLNQMFTTKLSSLGLIGFKLIGFTFLVCCCLTQTSANEFGIEFGTQSQDGSDSALKAYRSGFKTRADFVRVSKFIKNSKADQWRKIEWIPSLWDGVEASQARNKPMFIWAMNGDPLGCV